jgi:spore coat polysaccharide biosynthesis predicted glycosyltransferase SpsG
VQLPSLAGPLAAANVVVTSGGNSMIEAVAMGKPTLVIGTARNQLDLCREFARAPYILFAGEHGDVTGEAIVAALDVLPDRFNREIRPALVAHPVDTNGARRVAAEVLRHLDGRRVT